MIPASELTAMQATVNSALDKTIVIKRATASSDGAGGQSLSWSTIATVSGNLAQPSGALLQNYDFLVGSESTWKVRLASGTDVKENDELVVGGLTLRVQVILQPQSYSTAVNLLAAEVQ